jgi:predicted transcriptional regulator
MKLSEIVRILEATVLTGADQLDVEIERCGASDLMSDVLAGLADGSLLLTGLATLQAVRTASIAGVGAIVFVRGKQPPDEVQALASSQGLPLISTPCSMFVACGRLHACRLSGLNGKR